MPKTKQDLFALLDELNIKTTTFDHEPAFTVEQSQSHRDEIPGGHTKNLFLKDKKSNYFLMTLRENAVVDLKTIHTLIGAKGRLSFGKPDRLMEYLGVEPGSVTALSVVNDAENKVQMVLDAPLLDHDIINCHPLKNDATTSIKREDLLSFLKHCGHDPLILKVSQ